MLAAAANPSLGDTFQGTMCKTVRASSLVKILAGMLLVQHLLLWQFLGLSYGWTLATLALVVGCCISFRRRALLPNGFTVDLGVITTSFAVSLLLFALGGEGRFFYQTSDWQVRNAVLHDLVLYPWPFAYEVRSHVDMLRAPLGLYMLPALAGKIGGLRCAELAFLMQSALFLSCILSLGAGLFRSNRERFIALGIFVGFSGMDVVGTWLVGRRLDMHLEWWNVVQFSSTVTLAYWVPMHAIAGWTGAVLYLLWRIGRVPLGVFFAFLPLLAILSPLALLGIIPFAVVAGVSVIWGRSLHLADVVLVLGAIIISIPSLLYLSSALGGAIGAQGHFVTLANWTVFEFLEVLPYLLAIAATGAARRFGEGTLLATSLLLLLLPWVQLGSDIPMRASISPLAILSVMLSDLALSKQLALLDRTWRAAALTVFLIGTVTPLSETLRAVYGRRPPPPTCSYFGVVPGGTATYVAPLYAMRSIIAPKSPVLVRPSDPSGCRELDWKQMELRNVLHR